MKALVIALALAAIAATSVRAEDVDPRPPVKEVRVEEKAASRLEILTLQIQNLQLQLELGRRQLGDLAAERERIGREAARDASLAWDDYDVDLTQRPLTWRLKKR